MILDTLDIEKQKKILDYLDLVIEKNTHLNLTTIDTREKGIILHIEDSLSVLEEYDMADGRFLDIGTGGGFPGIPLAIATGMQCVLIDSIAKKALAVEEMVKKIGLDQQVDVIAIRSEDYAKEVGACFDLVVSRAVAALPVVEEFASPLLKQGGKFIAMRGRVDQADYEASLKAADLLGLELESKRKFLLDEKYERTILLFRKRSPSKVNLPRRNGMAQKHPLA